jgi:hypothetical protein
LIAGTKWDSIKYERVNIHLIPGLLQLAEQYKICSRMGRKGSIPVGEYLSRKLIEDIRKEEEKRKG